MPSTRATQPDFVVFHPGTPVICSLEDPELGAVAVRAVVDAGGAPRPITWDDLVSQLNRFHYSALIYDLAPCDQRSWDIITAARSRCPWMPIMLYVAPTEPGLATIPLAQSLVNVRVLAQRPASSEHTEFTNEVGTFLDELPLERVLRLIMGVVPDKTPILQAYLSSALWALECGKRVRVNTATAGLKVSVRTLQRRLNLQLLPYPKEMLDWATLIYTALLSNVAQMPVSRIAHYLGLTSHDLYRLRHRLAPKAGGACLSGREQVLPSVVRAFATRCGVSEGGVDEVYQQLLGAQDVIAEHYAFTIEQGVST